MADNKKMVKFGRGTKSLDEFKLVTDYENMVYFNTTNQEIYVGANKYGFSSADKALLNSAIDNITYTEATATFTISFVDSTKQDVTFSIPTADKTTPGLMTSNQVTALNAASAAVLTLTGEGDGSVKKAQADAEAYAKGLVEALDLTEVYVEGQNKAIIKIKQEDGKVTAEAGVVAAEYVSLKDADNKYTAETVEDAFAEIATRLGNLDTSAGNVGNQIKTAIEALDEDKSGTSTSGHVTVQVVQTDGKISGVNVTDSDIASETALNTLSGKVGTVAEGKTVVGMIADAKAEAKTEIAAKNTGHVTISSSTARDGHVIYTFSENNIAKADELDTLEASVGAAGDEANANGSVYARIAALVAEDGNLDSRLDALEGDSGALATAKKYTDDKIAELNATVGSQDIAEGKHVAVEVVETAGKLTALTVTENNIASAADLGALSEKVNAFLDAEGIKDDTLNTLKEIQDYITSEASAADQMVLDIAANREAIEKEVEDRQGAINGLNTPTGGVKGEGTFVDVTVEQAAGVITSVTVEEADIASAAALKSLSDIVGTSTDSKEKNTVYGAIAAEKDAREKGDADIKATIGTVSEGKTVVDLINEAKSAAVAAGTIVAGGTDEGNNLSISATNNEDGSKTYTINLSDVASKTTLNTLSGKVGTVAEGKTVVGMIAEAQSAAEGHADGAVQALKDGDVKDNKDAIEVLNGADTVVGSVAKAAKDTLASANAYTDTALTWFEG